MSLASILGYVDDITETSIHGWVCDSNNLDFSVVVEIYENGVKIGETAADIYRPDLYDAGLGNGNYGFSFNFPLSLQSKKISVKVKDCDYELPKSQGLLDKEGDLNELENKATEITHNLKSLLLIGFPRGFTTQSYEIIKKATGLRSSNVSAGEVLNRGRLLKAGFVNESLKLKNFPFYTKNLELYPVIEQELNKYKKGFIIKDVVHPWLVLEYISRNPTTYNVLFVSRNLNEVTFHLNKLDWRIYTGIEELQDKFRYFPTLDVELAMHDSDYLFDTVEKLGYTVERFNYIDQDFVEKREKTKKLFQVYGNSLRDINLVYNYALKINTPIKLHLHENPVHPCLRIQGWSCPELTGIWTQKKVAELIFYVDTFYGSDLCLAVEIEGVFVHKNHPKQTIEVFANEILIDKWDFNYATKIDKLKKCRIPSYTINSNSRLFISFQISNPESPFNLGISNDTRKLGVKINHIQFLKV